MRSVRAPGAARSEKEIIRYIGSVAPCTACGAEGLVLTRYTPSDVRGEAAVVEAQCALCFVPTQTTFDAGPGWDAQPPDGDPRMATGTSPSALLPESYFRAILEIALRELGDADQLTPAARRDKAALAIEQLTEIRKLKQAARSDLAPEDRAQLQRCSELFIANGGTLAPELQSPT